MFQLQHIITDFKGHGCGESNTYYVKSKSKYNDYAIRVHEESIEVTSQLPQRSAANYFQTQSTSPTKFPVCF